MSGVGVGVGRAVGAVAIGAVVAVGVWGTAVGVGAIVAVGVGSRVAVGAASSPHPAASIATAAMSSSADVVAIPLMDSHPSCPPPTSFEIDSSTTIDDYSTQGRRPLWTARRNLIYSSLD